MKKHNSNYPEKRLAWQARISQQAASGKTIEMWCKEHDLCVTSFYRWKRLLNDERSIELIQPVTSTICSVKTN